MPDHNSDHNPAIPHTRTPILVSAMRLLAQEIQSEDGVANAAIAEAANRLSELEAQLAQAQQGIGEGITRPHDGPEGCPTYHDGCNCTVEVLAHNIERAKKAERRVAELEAILRRVDVYFQHTGKVGDLPVSVHALLPRSNDGNRLHQPKR